MNAKKTGSPGKGVCLCRPCLEAVKAEGKKPRLVFHGVDKKVTCHRCGRRRYGGTYEV